MPSATGSVRERSTGALRRHPFAARFVVASTLLFAITLMWSLGSPVPSGPDEEAQLIKSAAIVRGTLIGTPEPGISAGTVLVTVPGTIANAQLQAHCGYKHVDIPVCGVRIPSSSTLVVRSTYEGRYPPVYYALTGLPTLLSSGDWTLHAMRLMSALACSLLLGLAFAGVATYGRSGLLTLATAFVVTPTVLYISSVVNPSALEIAGAIAMWAALVVIVVHRADDPPLPLVVTATIGAMAMCASRPLSTLWYALIIASLALLRPKLCRSLLGVRRIRIGLAVSLAFAFLSGVYVLVAKSYKLEAFPLKNHPDTTFFVLSVLGHGPKVLRQAIGAFGAPNFSVPIPIQAIWIVGGFGVIAVACLVARRRDALVLLGSTLFLGFLLPFVIIFSHVKTDGVIWQGRYSLPFIAGLPMIAAVVIAERHPSASAAVLRRLSVVTIPLLTIGCVGSFYWYLRRFTVGLAMRRANAFKDYPGHWSPVVPAPLLFLVVIVASVAFGAWLFRQTLRASGAPAAPRRAGPPSSVANPPSAVGVAPVAGPPGTAPPVQAIAPSQSRSGSTRPAQPL
jgi:hypothetical protein